MRLQSKNDKTRRILNQALGKLGQDESYYTNASTVQEYLANKRQRPPRTLHWDYAWGPMVALGGGSFL